MIESGTYWAHEQRKALSQLLNGGKKPEERGRQAQVIRRSSKVIWWWRNWRQSKFASSGFTLALLSTNRVIELTILIKGKHLKLISIHSWLSLYLNYYWVWCDECISLRTDALLKWCIRYQNKLEPHWRWWWWSGRVLAYLRWPKKSVERGRPKPGLWFHEEVKPSSKEQVTLLGVQRRWSGRFLAFLRWLEASWEGETLNRPQNDPADYLCSRIASYGDSYLLYLLGHDPEPKDSTMMNLKFLRLTGQSLSFVETPLFFP